MSFLYTLEMMININLFHLTSSALAFFMLVKKVIKCSPHTQDHYVTSRRKDSARFDTSNIINATSCLNVGLLSEEFCLVVLNISCPQQTYRFVIIYINLLNEYVAPLYKHDPFND